MVVVLGFAGAVLGLVALALGLVVGGVADGVACAAFVVAFSGLAVDGEGPNDEGADGEAGAAGEIVTEAAGVESLLAVPIELCRWSC
ncbi:MAG: hypothetical protein ACRDV3_04405 [Acidothermaceae bacterium]